MDVSWQRLTVIVNDQTNVKHNIKVQIKNQPKGQAMYKQVFRGWEYDQEMRVRTIMSKYEIKAWYARDEEKVLVRLNQLPSQ